MMETTPKSVANIQMSQKIVKQNLQTVYPGVLGADRKQRCSTRDQDSHDSPHRLVEGNREAWRNSFVTGADSPAIAANDVWLL